MLYRSSRCLFTHTVYSVKRPLPIQSPSFRLQDCTQELFKMHGSTTQEAKGIRLLHLAIWLIKPSMYQQVCQHYAIAVITLNWSELHVNHKKSISIPVQSLHYLEAVLDTVNTKPSFGRESFIYPSEVSQSKESILSNSGANIVSPRINDILHLPSTKCKHEHETSATIFGWSVGPAFRK